LGDWSFVWGKKLHVVTGVVRARNPWEFIDAPQVKRVLRLRTTALGQWGSLRFARYSLWNI